MVKKRHINWLGWTVGSWLIIYAAHLEEGLGLALVLAGAWTIITGFSYHTIAVVTGFENWLEGVDEEVDEAVEDDEDE